MFPLPLEEKVFFSNILQWRDELLFSLKLKLDKKNLFH